MQKLSEGDAAPLDHMKGLDQPEAATVPNVELPSDTSEPIQTTLNATPRAHILEQIETELLSNFGKASCLSLLDHLVSKSREQKAILRNGVAMMVEGLRPRNSKFNI